MDYALYLLGRERMIVKIHHTWYMEKRYDLGKRPYSGDVQEFLHDVRAVTQFASKCEIRLVKGDL